MEKRDYVVEVLLTSKIEVRVNADSKEDAMDMVEKDLKENGQITDGEILSSTSGDYDDFEIAGAELFE